MKRGILKYILSLLLFMAAPAYAGGPLSVCSGIPTKYAGASTVTLNYDQGTLGSHSKSQADALVTEAVSLWTNVGTATVSLARGPDLPVDVTTANFPTYIGSGTYEDDLNPVVYDTDGSIIDMLIGVGAKNSILGFAGSAWYIYPTYCQYAEGRAVINGYIVADDTTLKIVSAHEIGHLIGLDHTQLDSTQGLSSSNYPLMYPIAYRGAVSLHEDDVAAVSALYPDTSLSSVYGQLIGTFTQVGGTPILGANLWAEETTSHQLFSIVSDYLALNTGYFKLLLPTGTYTLHAEAVQTSFAGGSSVGPYSGVYPTDPSFQPPLYVGGMAMTPVTLGNATPTQIAIIAGCAATAGFKLDGTGSIGGNCITSVPPVCTLTASPAFITPGASSTMTASCSPAATSYTWTGGTCAGTAGATCHVTPSATTVYSVIGTNTAGAGNAVTATVNVMTDTIVNQYYTSILGRPADSGGRDFWLGEAARMSNKGADAKEAYIAMAMYFFGSAEFMATPLTDSQFVDRLYLTFFNRAADNGGSAYWVGVLASGLPRDMVMYAFMFSTEFNDYMAASLGSGGSMRPEVGAVIDFYRGAFGRLPDDVGMKYWVNRFRTAQCTLPDTTGQVYQSAIDIAAGFFGSAEYWTPPPSDTKYVSDLYNAFMRRSADLAGVNYWVTQRSSGAQTYDQIRKDFIDSPEFAARVQAIVNAGCTALVQ